MASPTTPTQQVLLKPRAEAVSIETLRTVAQNLRMRYPGTLTEAEAEAITRRGIDQSPGFIAPLPPNSSNILTPQLRTRGALNDFRDKKGIFSPTGR